MATRAKLSVFTCLSSPLFPRGKSSDVSAFRFVFLRRLLYRAGTKNMPRYNLIFRPLYCACFLGSLTALGAETSSFPIVRAAQIASAAEALRPKLIETRRDFHMHPELSNREERTARVVAERLRALGFDEVKTNVAGHGVVALLKGSRPGAV